jgi:2-phospho-L-lactate guanylyltransferase
LADVQATVRSYDPATRSGSVLLDDGTELPYDGSALLGSSVRFLRSGQRVRIETVGLGRDARVAFLTIATMPDRRH